MGSCRPSLFTHQSQAGALWGEASAAPRLEALSGRGTLF